MIVRDVAEFHEPLTDAKQIELILAPMPEPILLISGDADLLFEAAANIIHNAIKFTPRNGRVAVMLADTPAVIVEDTGPGIAPEDRERVFVRFYRSEAGRNLPGNGLGLALVAAIARLNRLPLTIEGTGSGCRVRLGLG